MCRSYDYLLCLVNRNNKLTQLLLKRERLFNAVTVALAGEQTVKVCSRAEGSVPFSFVSSSVLRSRKKFSISLNTSRDHELSFSGRMKLITAIPGSGCSTRMYS